MNEAEAIDVCDRHTNRQVNAAILLVNCQRDAPDASVTTNNICLSFVTCWFKAFQLTWNNCIAIQFKSKWINSSTNSIQRNSNMKWLKIRMNWWSIWSNRWWNWRQIQIPRSNVCHLRICFNNFPTNLPLDYKWNSAITGSSSLSIKYNK